MTLFKLPFGRCLSPSPYRVQAAFKKGNLVAWKDGELGVVTDATEHSVTVNWQESPWSVYSRQGGAVDCITVLETEGA